MTSPIRAPFWLDTVYDEANADTRTGSRYGNYLRESGTMFTQIYDDDPSTAFAALAWRIANGPIMSPGLVRRHPRIIAATVRRSDWNGKPMAAVTLIGPRPAQLADARPSRGGWWRDRELSTWDIYEGPGEQDLERGAYLCTDLTAAWQLPDHALPTITEVPADHGIRYRLALECVEVLVGLLNREIRPIIEHIEKG